MPFDLSNQRNKDPQFVTKMEQILSDVNAEAAFFTTIEGHKGGYIVINMDDPSQIIAIAKPFFKWLGAEVSYFPVLAPIDLSRGSEFVTAAIKKWG